MQNSKADNECSFFGSIKKNKVPVVNVIEGSEHAY
jgi:hypothetical protein